MEARSGFRRFFKVAVAALAFALAFAMLAQPAFADESSSAAEASGSAAADSNQASESATVTEASESASEGATDPMRGGLPHMGDDYVWFGRDLELSNGVIGNDLIAAGEVVNVSKTSAAGDFRVAGQVVSLADSTAGQNITVAAEAVSIRDAEAKAIAAAANTLQFSGTCDELTAFADTVVIDGTVRGDVVVGANTVQVGENAHITGTLHVDAPYEPVVKKGAEVANIDYTQSEEQVSFGDLEDALAELAPMFLVFMAFMSIFGTLVVAVLAEWLFRRQTAGAATMIRTRTGATIGSGVVGALVAPLAVLLLICVGVTLPVAGAVSFALLAMSSVASGFAGASLFKLAFKSLGRFPCALIGGAIVGVAGAVPVLGGIVRAAAFMYLLGYVLQSIYLGMRDPAAVAAAPAE